MSRLNILKSIYRNILFDCLAKKRSNTSVEEAESGLQSFLHKEPPSFVQTNNINPQYDVMIIIPVYNAEKYLEQAINSILTQETKYTYQAVFIDDGSTDGSYEILKRCLFPPHVYISTKNQGLFSYEIVLDYDYKLCLPNSFPYSFKLGIIAILS